MLCSDTAGLAAALASAIRLSLQGSNLDSDWLVHLLSVSERRESCSIFGSLSVQFHFIRTFLLGVLGHGHGMAFRNVRCEIATPFLTVILSVKEAM